MGILKIEFSLILLICWGLLVFIFLKERNKRVLKKLNEYKKISNMKKIGINSLVIIIPTIMMIIPSFLILNI